MATKWIQRAAAVSMAVLGLTTAGCGDMAQQGRSPVQLVILGLQGASGADPDEFGSFVQSDVETIVTRDDVPVATIFPDLGQVTMQIVLKDQGVPGVVADPSPLNSVTITRYRVVYRRADGHNTPGIDVPFAFDGAITFTVPFDGEATAGFELVRHAAKREAPLLALATNRNFITAVADITFFGQDLAGNLIQATGSIQIDFGNFADPE